MLTSPRLNVLQALKEYKYDDKRIMTEFSIRRSMKKERLGIEFDRRRLRENKKVTDLLPLGEQIMRIKVGIGGGYTRNSIRLYIASSPLFFVCMSTATWTSITNIFPPSSLPNLSVIFDINSSTW